jgi:hypothetical protein
MGFGAVIGKKAIIKTQMYSCAYYLTPLDGSVEDLILP